MNTVLIEKYIYTQVLDMCLLISAVNMPFQFFGCYDMYSAIYEKAARPGFGLVQNHAFIDSSMRIAALAMLGYLSDERG